MYNLIDPIVRIHTIMVEYIKTHIALHRSSDVNVLVELIESKK